MFTGKPPRSKPSSNMAFLMLLRGMKIEVTPHGFRSTFRDWASERTHFSNEVCDKAPAHTINDKAEGAYWRSDLLEKRREPMSTWAAFAESKGADFVPLRTG